MPVDVPTFLTNYPEFANVPTPVVQNALNDAYSMTPAATWPVNLLDQGAQLRCAQSLALSPFARGTNPRDDGGKTAYDERLERLVRIAARGLRVVS